MFEHILLETSGGSKWKKGLSIVVSTLTQCALICAMIVSPLLFTEGMPRVAKFTQRWMEPPPPLPVDPGQPPPQGGSAQHGGMSISRPRIEGDRPDFRIISDTIPPGGGSIDIGPAPTIGNGGSGAEGGIPTGTGTLFASNYKPPSPPPPPTVKQDKPVPITNIESAKILYRPQPIYPPIARQMRQQGIVRLEAIISRSGVIENLRLVSGPPLLVEAALAAVREWRYQPTMLNGQPVEVITTIEVHFTLNQ